MWRISRLFGLPQGLAFLPACTLAAYWAGGEAALLFASLIVPLLYSAFGQITPPEELPARDTATGLPLRKAAQVQLDGALAQQGGPHGRVAALVIAVEGVADVAQRLGLPAGDDVLEKTGQRLCSALRDSDLVVRAEGDCFAVALSPMARGDLETVLQICARLQEAVREPISLDATAVYVSAAIGFCLAERSPAQNGDAMLKSAETAMLEARAHGPGAIRAFSADMQVAAKSRSDMIDDLAVALEKRQIQPWFQPQLSTDTGQICGFEALARWQHPRRGVVPPGAFLSAIEQAGLARQLGEEMLVQALSALRAWDAAGLEVPTIGVNFSGHELRDPHFADHIHWELDRFGLAPERLAVEILETVVCNRPDDMIVRNIAALAELGCRIDLDDFGTGQTSIVSIRRFPVSRLKIDRSFVTNVDNDRDQQDMVAAILTMSERLGLETLAEGVETPSEHAMLAQLGCTAVQGFGIAHPMPFDDTIEWITRHNEKLAHYPVIRRHMG